MAVPVGQDLLRPKSKAQINSSLRACHLAITTRSKGLAGIPPQPGASTSATMPCRIKGAGREDSPERPTLTIAQVYALADATQQRYRALVLLMPVLPA